LAGLDPRELGLLVVGDHIDVRQRHDIDQVAADIDVVALLNLALADDAVEGRNDFGVAELQPRAASAACAPSTSAARCFLVPASTSI
jgi:hypothetical protein